MPKWRGNSEFGTGPRVPLCRESRSQWLKKLMLNRKPGRLTMTAVVIGRIMLDMIGADGRLDPSIDLLARRAGDVAPSTVVRALARLRECGFLTWARRLVRDAASGWRCAQTSNAYVLTVPAACDTQFAKQVFSSIYKKRGTAQAASTDLTDREAFANRDRQLEAIRKMLEEEQMRASG